MEHAFSNRITRREALAGGAGGTVALMSERAEAQQAAPAEVRVKGPAYGSISTSGNSTTPTTR